MSTATAEKKKEFLYADGAIIEPIIPFEENIECLNYGDMIYITGVILPQSSRFQIDLRSEKDDIILHVNPRFPQAQPRVLVLNTHKDGGWLKEQRCGMHDLKQGNSFNMIILVHDSCFKIAINNSEVAKYEHLMFPELVTKITISGEIKLHSFLVEKLVDRVNIEQKKHISMPPLPWYWNEKKRNDPAFQNQVALPCGYNLSLPYSVLIPEGMKIGRVIYLTVIPTGLSKGFSIQLRKNDSEGADSMMKMQVSFTTKQTLFSRSVNNKTQQEVASTFLFKKLHHADIILRVTPEFIQVAANNRHFHQFKHGLQKPANAEYQCLHVSGDITFLALRVM